MSMFEIKTELARVHDYTEVMEFSVRCVDPDGAEEAGHLRGFLWEIGAYPDFDEVVESDFLDERSGHAHGAFLAITQAPERVNSAISIDDVEDEKYRFVYLERGWVNPAYRAQGLMLRLMREARQALHAPGTLALLTAFPDGEGVAKADQLRLASYYMSDRTAGFRPLDPEEHTGLLVADWDDGAAAGDDSRTWSAEAGA